MKLEKVKNKIDTYSAGNGFMVDIVTFADDRFSEAWLYHEDICIKEMMFGLNKVDMTTGIVLSNLPEYIQGYKEKYL